MIIKLILKKQIKKLMDIEELKVAMFVGNGWTIDVICHILKGLIYE